MTQDRTLLVFAHRDEAHAFSDVPHLVTGVGKVNAAVELAGALAERGAIRRVVVLGTAGVVDDGPDLSLVYQVASAVQHDFALPSEALRLGGSLIAPTAVVATGDVFVRDDVQRAAIAALGASLVDMETYAYASVCARLRIPLQVFKAPSDFADSATTDAEWDAIVFEKSAQLRAFCADALPEVLG